MSSIARLYSTLSGSAVLSALVALLTFFFLCRSWAWLEPTLSSNAAINVDVNVHVRVRRKRKLHLSLKIFRRQQTAGHLRFARFSQYTSTKGQAHPHLTPPAHPPYSPP